VAAALRSNVTAPRPIATLRTVDLSGRASSVAEIDALLAGMWTKATAVVPSASHPAAPFDVAAAAIDDRGEIRVRARTSVLTLVVVAGRPEVEERALATIDQLAGRHPSRAIILAPSDPDGPARLDARVSLACTIRQGGPTETCAERILLRAGGESARHLAGIVAPLLIHDLPAVIWWADDAPVGSPLFRELAESADQVLVDSAAFRDDGHERLAALAALIEAGSPAVRDVAWVRLAPWRELLAGLFDHPLLLPETGSARSVRIDVLRPGMTLRMPRAALLAGWLEHAFGWTLRESPAARGGGESRFGTWSSGRHEVRLEIRPVSVEEPAGTRDAGSLRRVELELRRGHHVVRARVTRQADHLLATADWDGAEIARRVGRIERYEDVDYVAEALSQVGRDRLYEAAARRAARIADPARP
jgi:glucose-6-phosphate dehydrogenase assembly protein OpcA